MNTKRISLLILCMICISIFCSCSDKKPQNNTSIPEAVTPQRGGSIKLGCVAVDSLNPLVTNHASVSDFLSLVYEGLFVTNADLTTEPVLAEDYTVSEGNTLYKINLKKDVSFHNGKRFTAKDVMATMDYMALYSTRWSDTLSSIAGYTSDGDHCVVIRLNSPKSDFAANLDFPILPEGLLADDFVVPNPGFVPNGTGMYKYDTTEAYKSIILKANDNWKNGTDRPYIDEVKVEILSDDETIISAFDAGTIDCLTTSWRGFDELKLASSLFNTFSCEQNRFTYLGINDGYEAFDTPKERRRLWSSIDVKKITEEILLGNGVIASSPVRDTVYFNSQHEDESSVKIQDPNDNSAESTPIECTILYNSDSKTKSRIASSLKQQLESAGYIVTLDGQDRQTYTNKVLLGNYQIYIGEVQMSGNCDLSFMFSSPTNGFCLSDDGELRNLVANLNKVADEKEKTMAWENFERYYTNSAIQVPLFFTNKAAFVNKRIIGSLKPNLSNSYYGFDDLFIKMD